ncbi:MAG: nucleotide exchange factor GrpE [Candidatus Dojkabacteria bacterium]
MSKIKDKTKNSEIEELKQRLEQEEESRLMALADLENFRKRAAEERINTRLEANLSVFRSLAELIDDFERLIEDLDQKSKQAEVEVFKPILEKALGILADFGVKPIEIKQGDRFSSDNMEAIGTTHVEKKEDNNSVVNIAQKGYIDTNSGRVIRHARVIVGKSA